jgi:bifunctional DNA-binding transcriptional regulator/antitoxin component of YhaV-PrlF toxin-antitoxin module
MKEMGWTEGDELSFDLDDRGRWIISKKSWATFIQQRQHTQHQLQHQYLHTVC